MKKILRRSNLLFKGQKGEISGVLVAVIMIVLVLALIGVAFLPQVSGVKETGKAAEVEQIKVNNLVQDPSIVQGTTVLSYNKQVTNGATFTVTIQDTAGGAMLVTAVKDGAQFKMSKTYNANGEVSNYTFKQVNLAQ